MGRTRTYERDDVLKNAAEVFWTKGYKATSMADIVQATGLNTASMYKEFGDKNGIFEEALDYYDRQIIARRLQILIDDPSISGVRAFLKDVITGAASKRYKGCLMMNHLAQRHSISPKAANKVGDFCKYTESLLETALRNAQAAGDLPAGKNPAILASFIMCNVHGLVLYGRHPGKKGDIPDLYNVILQALDG